MSKQASFLPEPTTAERIAAEAARKARKGGREACDFGLFSDEARQLDLVDAARTISQPTVRSTKP